MRGYAAGAPSTSEATKMGLGVAGGIARDAAGKPSEPAPTLPSNTTSMDSSAAAMIIRNGRANVEVDSLDVGMSAVRGLAERLGGYIANTSVQTGRDQIHSATLELEIPATRFDEALTGLHAFGKVESVDVTAEDVGEEYVDVGARVANARRLEQRLVQLLAARTGKLSDVLQVERELARVREEIERYEGRLRYLRTHVAVSTISVTVHEPLPVVGDHGSQSVLAESFRQAWRNFVRFIAGFIASLGTLIPLVVVLGGLTIAAVKIAKRLRGELATRGPRTSSADRVAEGS
jgi:hypothetical protein